MRSDELDARSDVYSLGVVAYEMLTGRVPFHSDTPMGYAAQAHSEAPPPFRTVAQGSGVPPAVESVVLKALTKDRNHRYASALDFAHALTSAATPSPQAEPPVVYPSTQIAPLPANEAGAALPSTKIATPAAARESAAPTPQYPHVAAMDDTTVQVPPPLGSPGRAEAPSAQPQGSKPVVPGGPLALSKPPALDLIIKRPNWILYIVLGLVLLAVIAGGIYHFLRPVSPPPPIVVSPSSVVPGPTGTVIIQTAPGAEVFLDDSSLGPADTSGQLTIRGVTAGSHELRITAPDKRDYQLKITVAAGQEARIEAALVGAEPKPAPRRPGKPNRLSVEGKPKRLSVDDILALLHDQIPNQQIVSLVKGRGIIFSPTNDDLRNIRAAGGTGELIQAIRLAAPGGALESKGVSEQQILSMLREGIPSSHVAEIIRERGINFSPSADGLNQIRAAGGTQELIQALLQAATGGG